MNIARIALSPLAPRTAISNSLLLELQRVQGTTGCWEINVAAGGNENWQNASQKIPSDIEGDRESSSLSNQNLFKIAWLNHPRRKNKFIHFWVGTFRIVIISEIRPIKVHNCSTWTENPQRNVTWITERDNNKKIEKTLNLYALSLWMQYSSASLRAYDFSVVGIIASCAAEKSSQWNIKRKSLRCYIDVMAVQRARDTHSTEIVCTPCGNN